MNKSYRIGMLLFTVIISVILSASHIILMSVYYEPTVDFFKTGTILPTCFYYILASLIAFITLFAIVKSFVERKQEYSSEKRENVASLYFGLLAGFIMLVAAVMRAKSFLTETLANPGEFSVAYFVSLFVILTSVPTAFYFFVISFQKTPSLKAVSTFGTTAIFWSFLYVLDIYFDVATALTSPIRILNQLTPIALMMFFIYDMRQRLGIPKPIYYMASASVSAIMIFVTCSAEIYLFAIGETRAGGRLMFTVAELCIGLYVLSGMSLHVEKQSKESKPEEKEEPSDIFDAESEMAICEEEQALDKNVEGMHIPKETLEWWESETDTDAFKTESASSSETDKEENK